MTNKTVAVGGRSYKLKLLQTMFHLTNKKFSSRDWFASEIVLRNLAYFIVRYGKKKILKKKGAVFEKDD